MTCPACNTPADPLSNCPRCSEFVPVTVTPKQATIPDLQPPLAAEIDSLRAQLQVAKSQTESDARYIVELRAALQEFVTGFADFEQYPQGKGYCLGDVAKAAFTKGRLAIGKGTP